MYIMNETLLTKSMIKHFYRLSTQKQALVQALHDEFFEQMQNTTSKEDLLVLCETFNEVLGFEYFGIYKIKTNTNMRFVYTVEALYSEATSEDALMFNFYRIIDDYENKYRSKVNYSMM